MSPALGDAASGGGSAPLRNIGAQQYKHKRGFSLRRSKTRPLLLWSVPVLAALTRCSLLVVLAVASTALAAAAPPHAAVTPEPAPHAPVHQQRALLADASAAAVTATPQRPWVWDSWRNWLGLFFSALNSLTAAATGQGGSQLLVPIFSGLLLFTANEAAALSAFVQFLGAFPSVYHAATAPHPLDAALPLIDYPTAALVMPPMLVGIQLGVFFNALSPAWFVSWLMVAVYLWGTVELAVAYARLRCSERRRNELLGRLAGNLLNEDDDGDDEGGEENGDSGDGGGSKPDRGSKDGGAATPEAAADGANDADRAGGCELARRQPSMRQRRTSRHEAELRADLALVAAAARAVMAEQARTLGLKQMAASDNLRVVDAMRAPVLRRACTLERARTLEHTRSLRGDGLLLRLPSVSLTALLLPPRPPDEDEPSSAAGNGGTAVAAAPAAPATAAGTTQRLRTAASPHLGGRGGGAAADTAGRRRDFARRRHVGAATLLRRQLEAAAPAALVPLSSGRLASVEVVELVALDVLHAAPRATLSTPLNRSGAFSLRGDRAPPVGAGAADADDDARQRPNSAPASRCRRHRLIRYACDALARARAAPRAAAAWWSRQPRALIGAIGFTCALYVLQAVIIGVAFAGTPCRYANFVTVAVFSVTILLVGLAVFLAMFRDDGDDGGGSGGAVGDDLETPSAADLAVAAATGAGSGAGEQPQKQQQQPQKEEAAAEDAEEEEVVEDFGGVRWTRARAVVAFPLIIAIGAFSGMLGMSGSVFLIPVLLRAGLHPQVTAATVKLLLLVSTGASSISFLARGALNVVYGAAYGVLGLLMTPPGQMLLDRWVARTGSPSLLVALNLGRYVLGVVLLFAVVAVPASIDAAQTQLPRAGFLTCGTFPLPW